MDESSSLYLATYAMVAKVEHVELAKLGRENMGGGNSHRASTNDRDSRGNKELGTSGNSK